MGINVSKCIQGKQKNQHQKLFPVKRGRLYVSINAILSYQKSCST
jgi:hypothetical protein